MLGWALMVNALTMARHRAAEDLETAARLPRPPRHHPGKDQGAPDETPAGPDGVTESVPTSTRYTRTSW